MSPLDAISAVLDILRDQYHLTTTIEGGATPTWGEVRHTDAPEDRCAAIITDGYAEPLQVWGAMWGSEIAMLDGEDALGSTASYPTAPETLATLADEVARMLWTAILEDFQMNTIAPKGDRSGFIAETGLDPAWVASLTI